MKGGQGQGKEEVRRGGLEFAGRQSTDTFCSAFVLLVSLFISLSPQTLLDMVENYPTALRTLILAENNISPELQQQISDLLSEGEEEEETEAHEVTAREKNPWICQNSKSSGSWNEGRNWGVWGVSSATGLLRWGW